ncbi:MAG: DUF4349 domain-containing protein [Spirochaetota bacterium]
MKKVIIIVIVNIFAVTGLCGAANNKMDIIRGVYHVGVYNTVHFTNETKIFTREQGGYVQYYSDDRIIIRLPVKHLNSFRNFVADKAYINDEQQARENVGHKIINTKITLQAKEKLLNDLFKIMSTSGFSHTVEIEKELSKVILEIEKLKGRLRYLKDRMKNAEITLFINEQSVQKSGNRVFSSEWDWIRELGIEQLVNSF